MDRFTISGRAAVDRHSGLMWSQNASPGDFPMTWSEAFAFIDSLNRQRFLGHGDWRLPGRRELFSLISHAAINPALPPAHPFTNVFSGYYWTATTCCRLPDQAWYVHLGGARVFKGMKHASYMVWPVRTADGKSSTLWTTGQTQCYGEDGRTIACSGTGQDADTAVGRKWPVPRWRDHGDVVEDRLSGLVWMRRADIGPGPVDWLTAKRLVAEAAARAQYGYSTWRLPTVRELESLCDMGRHSPALPADHPFRQLRPYYWSATTSRYEQRYAWALYLQDGNIGVGFKTKAEFHVWPVCGSTGSPPA